MTIKLYQRYGIAKKHGATEPVTLNGTRRWAVPGIRPEMPLVSTFCMVLVGKVAGPEHNRTFAYGPVGELFALRVDGLGGGHTIALFYSHSEGLEAYAEFVRQYSEDYRWVPVEAAIAKATP